MNRFVKCFRTKAGWISLAVAFFPLTSLIVSFMLMGGNSPESNGAPGSERAAMSIWVLLALSMGVLMLVIKLAAVLGNVMGWYYGWLLHILELNFVLFFVGIAMILSILTSDFSVEGGVRVAIGLCCLVINIKLKAAWVGREVRERFEVGRMMHSEPSGAYSSDK